jgi:hypothetical protein
LGVSHYPPAKTCGDKNKNAKPSPGAIRALQKTTATRFLFRMILRARQLDIVSRFDKAR